MKTLIVSLGMATILPTFSQSETPPAATQQAEVKRDDVAGAAYMAAFHAAIDRLEAKYPDAKVETSRFYRMLDSRAEALHVLPEITKDPEWLLLAADELARQFADAGIVVASTDPSTAAELKMIAARAEMAKTAEEKQMEAAARQIERERAEIERLKREAQALRDEAQRIRNETAARQAQLVEAASRPSAPRTPPPGGWSRVQRQARSGDPYAQALLRYYSGATTNEEYRDEIEDIDRERAEIRHRDDQALLNHLQNKQRQLEFQLMESRRNPGR